jgi:hypothetical protein
MIGKPDREHEDCDAEEDRGQSGSFAKAVLRLQATGKWHIVFAPNGHSTRFARPDDRARLRSLAIAPIAGSIRQVDPSVMDRQLTIRIIDHGGPLANRRLGLLAWLHDEHDLVVLQGQRM